VQLDGVDIRDLEPTWLRCQMGVVMQEPTLFAGTVRHNLCYGLEGITDVRLEKAAADAHALDFISALPNLFETKLGEKGVSCRSSTGLVENKR